MSPARMPRFAVILLDFACLLFLPAVVWAAPPESPAVLGVPIDFILFAATLAGIALFHRRTLPIAIGGLIVISLYKIGVSPFPEGKDAIAWVRGGWHVAVAYVIGFFVMLLVQRRYPQPKHEAPRSAPAAAQLPAQASAGGASL